MVDICSPSQSPEVSQNRSPAVPVARRLDMQPSAPSPPQPLGKEDLFGSGNFSCMTSAEARARLQRQEERLVPLSDSTAYSPGPVLQAPSHVQPPQQKLQVTTSALPSPQPTKLTQPEDTFKKANDPNKDTKTMISRAKKTEKNTPTKFKSGSRMRHRTSSTRILCDGHRKDRGVTQLQCTQLPADHPQSHSASDECQ